jgi:Uma2 family endonuclease
MATATHLTFEEFQNLPEEEGKRYELDEGELLMEPSPVLLHNRIRDRIARRLTEFVERHQLGEITIESDFRLGPDTVLNPDVGFLTREHLERIDASRWPIDGAPLLAVEVISPSNSAERMAKKIRQYLRSGCRSVWVVYPSLHLVEVHSSPGVRQIESPEPLTDEAALPGFSMALPSIFEGKK